MADARPAQRRRLPVGDQRCHSRQRVVRPPRTVVGHGIYSHVNDPSVVKKDGTWFMALTTATSGNGDDLCSLLTSPDALTWPGLVDRRHEIRFSNATVTKCARPSLIWNATAKRWELYFDGEVDGGPHGGQLATSAQPLPTDFTWRATLGDIVEPDVRADRRPVRRLLPPQGAGYDAVGHAVCDQPRRCPVHRTRPDHPARPRQPRRRLRDRQWHVGRRRLRDQGFPIRTGR